jgi:hypothetical protein
MYYQSCDRQNRDIQNGNQKLYIVSHYWRKYADDPGDQLINDEDVVRPENHLWADHTESKKWRSRVDRKSNIYSTTYGLCNNCYTSGPIHQWTYQHGMHQWMRMRIIQGRATLQLHLQLLGNC